MRLHHGWWLALLLAPGVSALGEAAAASANVTPGPPALPHGVRLVGGHYSIDVCDHDEAAFCFARRILPDDYDPRVGPPVFRPSKTAPTSTWMGPADVVAAYTVPPSSRGEGRIVAVVDEPDSHAYADITAYRAFYKLPALPACTGGLPDGKTACFAQVDESGAPSDAEDCGKDVDLETGLDMAMVSAACPDCALLVVQMTSTYSGGKCRLTTANFASALLHATQTAATLGASATSISYGEIEQGSDPTGYTTAGHLVLAASGDYGYDLGVKSGTPWYPASSPDVLGVGGTNLAPVDGGYVETVWNNKVGATTSGCSTEFAMPAFQTAYLAAHSTAFGGCAMRASADLSAAASFGPGKGESEADGIAVVNDGEWTNLWGTSAASPMVAAILTRMNRADAIAADLGLVYTHGSVWNDVTSGENDYDKQVTCTTDMCVAGVGWDGPTGLGTPNGEALRGLHAEDAGPEDGGGDDGGARDGGGEGGAAKDGGATAAFDATVGVGGHDAGASEPTGAERAGSPGDVARSSGGCSLGPPSESAAPVGALFSLASIALAFLGRRRRAQVTDVSRTLGP